MAVTPFPTDLTAEPTFRRLVRVRARQRLVRTALWAWCALGLLWLLPLGAWSAVTLPLGWTLPLGACLTTGGGLLWLLHQRIEQRESLPAARAIPWRRRTDAARSRSLWVSGAAASAGAAAPLLAATVASARPAPGLSSEALWLLVPLGGMALAARWGMRGALAGATAGVAVFLPAQAGMAGVLQRSLAVATLLLIVAVPVTAAWIRGRRELVAVHRPADDRRRSAEARALAHARETRFSSLRREAAEITTVLRADGTRCYVSPSVELVLGYPPEGLIGSSLWSDVHPDDAAAVLDSYLACLTVPEAQHRLEYRCRDSGGRWRSLDAVFTNLLDEAEIGGVVVSARDVTERRHYQERLAYQAHHDALTGLPNRARFLDLLKESLDRPDRRSAPLAVLFLDLDGFKAVNDRLGHAAGDTLLALVAERLPHTTRPGDTVARLGGDEFTVLLDGIGGAADAQTAAERLIAALSEPFAILGERVRTGASVGIALCNRGPGALSPTELLRRADIALYQAKDAGKGRAVLFTPDMDPAV